MYNPIDKASEIISKMAPVDKFPLEESPSSFPGGVLNEDHISSQKAVNFILYKANLSVLSIVININQ